MKVKIESKVTQSCLTLHDTMDCSLPGSSVHRIFQARVLEWGAIAFSIRAHRPQQNKEKGLFISFGNETFYCLAKKLNCNCLIVCLVRRVGYRRGKGEERNRKGDAGDVAE